MRRVLRLVGALVARFVVGIALEGIAAEHGEGVVLRTRDPARWLLAIPNDPAVAVERRGERRAYTAVPDAASRERWNARFAEKYGWGDAYIGAVLGFDDAIPIRLDPR